MQRCKDVEAMLYNVMCLLGSDAELDRSLDTEVSKRFYYIAIAIK